MGLENQLVDSAIMWGADYYGVADLSAVQGAILEQGGAEIAEYPRSISIGIALFHPIVNQLPQRQERAVAVGYRSHCYDIINSRLDIIISRLQVFCNIEGIELILLQHRSEWMMMVSVAFFLTN